MFLSTKKNKSLLKNQYCAFYLQHHIFHDMIPMIEQKNQNITGIPSNLKYNIEQLSGFSLDDVRVHYHSSKPAQLYALAYAQGTNIYIASGQEKYLTHELIHVIQQKQGIVKPTKIINGIAINDDPILEKEAQMQYIRPIPFSKYHNCIVAQCLFDSQILAHNINAPEGTQAHHIIPIQVIQESLELCTFSLNEFDKAWNGIALPSKTVSDYLPIHHGRHNSYTSAVKKYIGKNNMQKLVTDLNYARQTARHFRNMIENYVFEGVTQLNDINLYFRNVGRQAMYDFIRLENLEYHRIKYGYLTDVDWADLISLYFKIQIEGELTEEEKTWVRTITNNGSAINNINDQIHMQKKIGARLNDIKES